MSSDQHAPSGARGGAAAAPTGGRHVVVVHRVAAVVVAVVIAVVGVLGFAGGLGYFDTAGEPVMGLSTNGLLSTVSLVTAAVLLAAAIRGGELASTVMLVVGVLFLVSAFVNLAVLGTPLNLLAFRLPNVFFSIGAGLVLLLTGAYGRVSSHLPDDNPYRLARQLARADRGEGGDTDGAGADGAGSEEPDERSQPRPSTTAEQRADEGMAEAARLRANGGASEEQRRRLAAVDELRTHEERRRVWMDDDARDPEDTPR